MIAVLKHELNDYFHTLVSYIFIAFLLVFVGIGALLYNINSALANFEYVLGTISIGLVVIVPVLTMKTISEERKQKTDQLLYSLPLTTFEIVMGKYLALLVIFLIPMAVVCIYPLIFKQFGDVYLLTSYGCLFAFFMMGAALIAIGVFVSSLTDNMGFAAGISIPLLLFNYYSVTLAEHVSSTALGSVIVIMAALLLAGLVIEHVTKNENLGIGTSAILMILTAILYFFKQSYFEGLVPEIMKTLSLFDRFETFVNGRFDMTTIVFYITVIIFFLFLTIQSFEKRRYN